MQGTLRAGDSVRLDPPGRDVRVRSLQVFGVARDAVGGGARVAVNVPGIEVAELRRGAVLSDDTFTPNTSFGVRFRALAAALPLLRRRTPVRAYLGAAEILGTLVFESAPAGHPARRCDAAPAACDDDLSRRSVRGARALAEDAARRRDGRQRRRARRRRSDRARRRRDRACARRCRPHAAHRRRARRARERARGTRGGDLGRARRARRRAPAAQAARVHRRPRGRRAVGAHQRGARAARSGVAVDARHHLAGARA